MPGESASSDREIVTTRVVDAPRNLVFDVLTRPEHVANWWGPRGFTTTTRAMDVRPGGVWRFVMHGPDGTDYPNKIVFLEVVRPERLVYRHAGDAETEDVTFHTTVTLTEEGGRTRITMRAVFESAAELAAAQEKYQVIEGARQHADRLQEYVVEQVERAVVSTRVFDAPREQVFRAWIDPEHLRHWWGPKGFTSTFHEFDARPGGAWRFVMHGPDGVDYPNHSVFREVVAPERIVFDHLSGHHFEVTATFEDLGGRTRLIWRMLFDSRAELARVKAFVVGANEENLDRLEARLPLVT